MLLLPLLLPLPSGARRERSERRREGYPPAGSRPRSGLDRVARPRSVSRRLDGGGVVVKTGGDVAVAGDASGVTRCEDFPVEEEGTATRPAAPASKKRDRREPVPGEGQGGDV